MSGARPNQRRKRTPCAPWWTARSTSIALQRQTTVPTFVSATDVAAGSVRVFTRAEITADAPLASACLPDLFRAVDIDGRSYWDGGYLGNPVLTPFFAEDRGTTDILIVQVTPFVRAGVPEDAGEIMGRVSEITLTPRCCATCGCSPRSPGWRAARTWKTRWS